MRPKDLPIDAEQWWVFDDTMTQHDYVRQTLDEYRATPATCGQVYRDDHDLAVRLYQQRIPFTAVDGAFVLATARRTYRDPTLPPLSPIRSLRYFLPVIREILDLPVEPGEISYLWLKLQGKI